MRFIHQRLGAGEQNGQTKGREKSQVINGWMCLGRVQKRWKLRSVAGGMGIVRFAADNARLLDQVEHNDTRIQTYPWFSHAIFHLTLHN